MRDGRATTGGGERGVSTGPRGLQPDLICLSHLRWGLVFQRPQHLMTRFARERRVFFFEEPLRQGQQLHLHQERDASGVWILTPHVPAELPPADVTAAVRTLLDAFLHEKSSREYVLWYLTPMALAFSRHLTPVATVFDCMDELSGFAFAPADLVEREAELLSRADVVFTGGRSLYEAKRTRHPRVFCHPSSVDVNHFARARSAPPDPADQAALPRPRIGYAGVIDERMDVLLMHAIANRRPDWQLVLVGPVVKIDPGSLPSTPSVHALGGRPYAELPAYLAHWDVALLPFAHNDATRYISPTKTPEYLAAGLPVVSTSVADVVQPYGASGFVSIADGADAFVEAIAAILDGRWQPPRAAIDAFLATQSWDATWKAMRDDVEATVARKRSTLVPSLETAVSSVVSFGPIAAATSAPPALRGESGGTGDL
jgi:glycosyltransferase involved in cell wall biosynthesis